MKTNRFPLKGILFPLANSIRAKKSLALVHRHQGKQNSDRNHGGDLPPLCLLGAFDIFFCSGQMQSAISDFFLAQSRANIFALPLIDSADLFPKLHVNFFAERHQLNLLWVRAQKICPHAKSFHARLP